MSNDRRHANVAWVVADRDGELYSSIKDGAMFAVMMDIRDELQTLNRLLGCQNFVQVPATLRGIRRDLKKKGK